MKHEASTHPPSRQLFAHIIGIDEVGRGPLAGPVAVCAAMVRHRFDFSVFPQLNDSKKLSPKRREVIFETALLLQRDGLLRFAVEYEGPETIDLLGIEAAVRRALRRALSGVTGARQEPPKPVEGVQVFLDGRLEAPASYLQETVVCGDALVPIISLASVIAKVSRDRMMVEASGTYPAYDFSRNKGYGTSAHVRAIQEHGPSRFHRHSFLSGIAGRGKGV